MFQDACSTPRLLASPRPAQATCFPAEVTRYPDESRLLTAGHEACAVLERAGVPYMVGGGLAIWAYGRKRPTKDVDLFIPAKLPFQALDALGHEGFFTRDTDASWLYKAYKYDVLIDLIVWTTGNIRLDAESFARTRPYAIENKSFVLMGPEDVLFRKILSHREDRRDWYDGLSMLPVDARSFDWHYLLGRLQETHLRRVLAFMLYAQADLGPEAVPAWVVRHLLGRVSLVA